ncbi:MAG: hypothetical protein AB7F35_04725 [Acetobacteraceae bacterium]
MDGLATFDGTINLAQSTVQRDVESLVLLVTDDHMLARSVEAVCDFLDLTVEVVPSRLDMNTVLDLHNPMAIIAEVDGVAQDGYHVMMEVAVYDADLPVMLLTGCDPALMGAAEAVQEICGLTSLTMAAQRPHVVDLVDFLFKAGQQTGCAGLMPV